MLSLSSKDKTYGKDRKNFAAIRLPPCSLYFPVNPFTKDTSREYTYIAEQNPYERM